jgi:hypothetical protein
MQIAINLLDGLPGEGEAQNARVRALTGRDEALLGSLTDALPAQRITDLLATVTLRIGEHAPVNADLARHLTAGDRERLLIACAAATLGESVDVVARCPRAECRELIDLSVDLVALLQPMQGARPPDHLLAVGSDVGGRTLRFRLPTGADLEAAAQIAIDDAGAARASLLDACLLDIVDERDTPVARELEPAVAAALEDAIAALDPMAECTAAGDCPACGEPIRSLVDGFALLCSAVVTPDRLLAEIDSVARVYHWSEAEILALPLPRRRRYLELIHARSAA